MRKRTAAAKRRARSRLCAALAAALLCASAPLSPAGAQGADGVVATDIAAFIDWMPIESFNIHDDTYVRAEDLRGYGFDVTWDPAARTLSIAPNGDPARAALPIEKVNVRKADIPRGKKLYDIYPTDIRTDMMGTPIHAYNINGETLIQIDELARFGVFTWDAEKRQVSVELARGALDRLAAGQESAPLTVEGPAGLTAAYTGGVRDGLPDGAGHTHAAGSPESWLELEEFTYGAYSGGERDGFFYEQRYAYESGGSRAGQWRFYRLFTHYADGLQNGQSVKTGTALTYGYHEDMPYGYRIEQVCRNGRETGFRRECVPDESFFYGYRIEREGYALNGEYVNCEADPEAGQSLFRAAGADCALREDGSIVVWGQLSGLGKSGSDSFASLCAGQSRPAAEISPSVWGVFYRTQDGQLYLLELPDEANPDGRERLIAEGVTEISGAVGEYLTGDGRVWHCRDGGSRPVAEGIAHLTGCGYAYLDADGTLWEYMLERYEDGCPVFSGRYAILTDVVKADGTCALRADGTLWAWDYITHVVGDILPDGRCTTQPVQVAEGVTDFSADSGYVSPDGRRTAEPSALYLDAAGDLWAFGGNRCGRLALPVGIERAETPVRVMQNVRVAALGSRNGCAVTRDGALYVFGSGSGVPRGFDEDGSFADSGTPFRVETLCREIG